MALNLTESNKDYARFLPAISSIYTKFLSHNSAYNSKVTDDRVPDCFPHGLDSMDFLNEDKGLFSYKWGLYSAGHAVLDPVKSDISEAHVQKRDRSKVTLVGDSGGFQVAKGVLKFPWDKFKEPGGKCDEVRIKILKWLEHTADWSMILDVPSFSIHFDTGLKTFKECLGYTCHNNDFFMEWRTPGATKFLNVLQGNDLKTADQWYDAVKGYSDPKVYGEKAFEGWAMGGENMRWWYLILYRMIKLRDDGLLENKDWLHFLGTSHLQAAIQLTAIKRNLVKINPNLEVSFDSASAFMSVAKGLCYEHNSYKPKRFAFVMEAAKDNKNYVGMDEPYTTPFVNKEGKTVSMEQSIIMHPTADTYLKTSDICVRGTDFESKTSWDSLSYVLIMAHNVYQHITAVQEANRLGDARDFNKVPSNVIEFIDLTNEVFQSEKPMEVIDQHKGLLNELSVAKFTGAPRRNMMEDFHESGLVDHMPGPGKKIEKPASKELSSSTYTNLFEEA